MAAKLKASHGRIGVISDTHGLVRPEVRPAFDGVDLILHAGDVGNAEVLKELASIARVIAVRGNNDNGPWAKTIPETEVVRIGRRSEERRVGKECRYGGLADQQK